MPIKQDRVAISIGIVFILILVARFLLVWPNGLIYPNSDLGTDLTRETYPQAEYIKTTLSETGQLPLWRPYTLSGTFLVGHPIIPLFYPGSWLVVGLPIPLALNLFTLGHLIWGFLGCFLYFRWNHALNSWASFAGAIIFAVAPKWIAHLSGGHYHLLAALAWTPWAWLVWGRLWQHPSLFWRIILGVILACLTLTNGHILILISIGLGINALVRLSSHQVQTWPYVILMNLGIPYLIMLGLSAIHLGPLLQALPQTNRTGLSVDEIGFGSLSPALLLGVLFPPSLRFPEWFLYPGSISLGLVLWGWACGWSKLERAWAAIMALGIILSLGTYTPLYRLLAYLPGFSLFRVPTRWWMFSLLAIAILAAYGLQKWLQAQPLRHTQGVTIWMICLSTIYIVSLGSAVLSPKLLPFEIISASLSFMVGMACLYWGYNQPATQSMAMVGIMLLLSFDLGLTSQQLITPILADTLLEPTAITDYLAPITANGGRAFAPYTGLEEIQTVHFRLHNADGYDSFLIQDYAQLLQTSLNCAFEGYVVAAPATKSSPQAEEDCPDFTPNLALLQMLNIQAIILPIDQAFVSQPPVVTTDDLAVYPLEGAMGLAFSVPQLQGTNTEACLETLAHVDPHQIALVEGDLSSIADSQPVQVTHWQTGVNRFEVTVTAASQGLLIRSETWASGWQAQVDGQAAPLLKVNCALQGVLLEPGDHKVVFEYNPSGYRYGRWISLSAIALVSLLLVLCIKTGNSRKIERQTT